MIDASTKNKEGDGMPKTAEEMEKIIMKNGWFLDRTKGSHKQYRHATKSGLVTIPFHPGELTKRVEQNILKRAGLK